jgi:AcrR family transcriptional regulator
MSQGRTGASIQEITDLAGVGFGSFYNHFETKEALFEAAVEEALKAWGALRAELVAPYGDPAEIFAVSFRMTGRLQREMPEMVRVLLNEGVAVLLHDEGLRPSAMADIAAGVEAGRFDIENVELGLVAVGGALLGLLQLLDSDPNADAGALADAMTVRVLRALGMSKDEAEELCSRELPVR